MDKDIDMMFVSQFSREVMEIIKNARQALTDVEYSEFVKSCKRLLDEMPKST